MSAGARHVTPAVEGAGGAPVAVRRRQAQPAARAPGAALPPDDVPQPSLPRRQSCPPRQRGVGTDDNDDDTPDPPRQLRRTPGREGDGTASQRARGACRARTHARDGTADGATPEAPRQHRVPRQLRCTPGVPGNPQRPGDGRSVGSRSQAQAIAGQGGGGEARRHCPPPNAKRARARDDLRLQRHECRAAHVRRHRGANPEPGLLTASLYISIQLRKTL